MKITPILLGLILMISFIPIASATASSAKELTTITPCRSYTECFKTKPSNPNVESSSSGGSGDSCMTRLGSDGRKLDLIGTPFLANENAVMNGKINFLVHSWEAPAGRVWKSRIIDGRYCFAWNPETRKKVMETPHTPIQRDYTILPMRWWHPNNRALW